MIGCLVVLFLCVVWLYFKYYFNGLVMFFKVINFIERCCVVVIEVCGLVFFYKDDIIVYDVVISYFFGLVVGYIM